MTHPMQKSTDLSLALGQIFMVGLPGKTLDAGTIRLIKETRIGNFILFKRNVENPRQVWRLCQDLRQTCVETGLPAPLISIDQEGGTVTRLPPPFTQFPPMRELAASINPDQAALRYARTCAEELTLVGINMNLAPVLDVVAGNQGLYMESRSLGDDPHVVGQLGSLIVRELQDRGIAACGKHFPGLGAAEVDPHKVLPRVARSKEHLRAVDLVPFRQVAAAGLAAIMTSHTVYEAMDPDHPATLSHKILTGLLRVELGYEGVLITDDLEMGAMDQQGPAAEAARAAFMAGADLLLICHDQDKARGAKDALAAAMRKGELAGERLEESLIRLGALKNGFVPSTIAGSSEQAVVARFS